MPTKGMTLQSCLYCTKHPILFTVTIYSRAGLFTHFHQVKPLTVKLQWVNRAPQIHRGAAAAAGHT